MFNNLLGILVSAAIFTGFWFIAPAVARGSMDIWYPSISDSGLRRVVWIQRAWVAVIGVGVIGREVIRLFIG